MTAKIIVTITDSSGEIMDRMTMIEEHRTTQLHSRPLAPFENVNAMTPMIISIHRIVELD